MDVNRLKEFITLVECGGFRAASQKLFISQSTLSRHIADLETQSRHMLITRDKPVSLTPSGIVLEQYARRFIALHDQLERDLASIEDDSPYNIMVQDVSPYGHLSELLASVRKTLEETFIGARFEYAPLSSSSSVDAVVSLMIDIGVIEVFTHCDEPLVQSSDDVDFVLLSSTKQPLSAFCRRSSPFGKLACITPRDLASTRLLASGMLSPDDTEQSMELLAAQLEDLGIAPSCSVLKLPIEKILTTAGDNEIVIAGASTAPLLLHEFHSAYSLKAIQIEDYQTGLCLVMRKNWKELAERLRDAHHLF